MSASYGQERPARTTIYGAVEGGKVTYVAGLGILEPNNVAFLEVLRFESADAMKEPQRYLVPATSSSGAFLRFPMRWHLRRDAFWAIEVFRVVQPQRTCNLFRVPVSRFGEFTVTPQELSRLKREPDMVHSNEADQQGPGQTPNAHGLEHSFILNELHAQKESTATEFELPGLQPLRHLFKWLDSVGHGSNAFVDVVPIATDKYLLVAEVQRQIHVWQCHFRMVANKSAPFRFGSYEYDCKHLALLDSPFDQPFYVFAIEGRYFFVTSDGRLAVSRGRLEDENQWIEYVWSSDQEPIVAVIEMAESGRVFAFTREQRIEINTKLERKRLMLRLVQADEPQRSVELLRACARAISSVEN
jgi:hypothetical protein